MTRLRPDVAYGPDESHVADVHLPTVSVAHPPLLVTLHGGGWYTGDKSLATRCCSALADRGLVVVNANYRIPTRDPVPTMVEDALAVLRWARSAGAPDSVRAAASHGIALAGDSAGAHVAALAALEPAASVSALVCWCGGLSLASLDVAADDPLAARFAVYVRALTGADPGTEGATRRLAELDPAASLVGSRLPPTLVTTSALDFFRSSSLAFAGAADAAGHSVEVLEFDATHRSCTHSWQLDPEFAESQMVYDRTADFVRAALTR